VSSPGLSDVKGKKVDAVGPIEHRPRVVLDTANDDCSNLDPHERLLILAQFVV
jgi:hypothetical protein